VSKWRPADEDPVTHSLIVADGLPDFAPDLVPTADAATPVATYRAWRPEDTRVITVRIANNLYPRDERFESRDDAVAAITARHGQILEANWVPGRGFLRVRRAGK